MFHLSGFSLNSEGVDFVDIFSFLTYVVNRLSENLLYLVLEWTRRAGVFEGSGE